MIEIKDLLARFNSILVSEESKTEVIRSVIGGVIGLKIKPEDIKIKNNVIYLNIKPIYKNEIFIKKEEIFDKLSQNISGRHPKKIR